jgi:uncharacterized membrane protein YfcA
MARVASAALATAMFATSVVGTAVYTVLSLVGSGDVAPDWWLGIACGLGGLVGGHLGARLHPRLRNGPCVCCSAYSPQLWAPCTPSGP